RVQACNLFCINPIKARNLFRVDLIQASNLSSISRIEALQLCALEEERVTRHPRRYLLKAGNRGRDLVLTRRRPRRAKLQPNLPCLAADRTVDQRNKAAVAEVI